MVAFEMFSATQGLGEFLTTAQRNFDISGSYAGAIAAGVVGYVLATGLLIAERRWILRWHFDMRRTAGGRA